MFESIPDRIRNETNDLIILDENKQLKIIFGLFLIFGPIYGIFKILLLEPSWQKLLFIFSAVFIFWIGLNILLVSTSVTIDKKSQNIIIQKNALIKNLESFKKIPFLHIKEIEIIDNFYAETGESWQISLITTYDKATYICKTDNESEARALAEKIHKITGREISVSRQKFLGPRKEYIKIPD